MQVNGRFTALQLSDSAQLLFGFSYFLFFSDSLKKILKDFL